MKLNKLVLYCFCLITAIHCVGQEKKMLLPEDYKLWSTLGTTGMSNDGKWVNYTITHSDSFVLYTKNTSTGLEYVAPRGYSQKFSDNSRWVGYIVKDSLMLIELATKRKHFVSAGVSEFHFSQHDSYVVVAITANSSKKLLVVNLKNFEITENVAVVEWRLNRSSNCIALVTLSGGLYTVGVLDLSSGITQTVLSGKKMLLKGLEWDSSGKKLVFFEELQHLKSSQTNHIVYWWSLLNGNSTLKQLNPEQNTMFPKGYFIPNAKAYVSEKVNYVFFDIKKVADSTEVALDKKLRIWKSEAVSLDPDESVMHLRSNQFWTLWNVDPDSVLRVENEEYGNVVLTGDDRNALLYNPFELAPMHKYGGDYIAVYLKSLDTGKMDLVAPKQVFFGNETLVSPGGKYVAYFTENNWWVYDIASKSNRCLTASLRTSLGHVDQNQLITMTPYGNPGWTSDDEHILVYDENDIWLIAPDGSSTRRLTDGKRTNTSYRLLDYGTTFYPRDSFFGFTTKVYNMQSDVLLATRNTMSYAEGFAYLKVNGKIQQLMERKSTMPIYDILDDNKTFLFTESNFELPPRLLMYKNGREKILLQSNLQQQQFHWGKSELIYYTNSKGEQLKGALFYPANYQVDKKYPMIVSIYQTRSPEVYNYLLPTADEFLGFNIRNYTADGYFVLLPDITYILNETGASAADCVSTAVAEALRTASIDSDSLALFGHSFGGYEASYIMGHTSIFRTAIIGSAMIDLASAYLTTDGHGFSNMWRFEYSQFRIDAPYYSAVFENNSPLKSAKNITAPLLIWTGTADQQLDWKHSMKLHSALWRFGKKSTLLIYPDEGHVFAERKNRIDLSNKIKDYLDFYLKGKPLQEWMGQQ